MKCDESCEACSGASSSECITCGVGYYLHEKTSFCGAICERGYVLNEVALTCDICRSDCSACVATLYMLEHTCVDKCPIGFKKQEMSFNRCVIDTLQEIRFIDERDIIARGISPFMDFHLASVLVNIDPRQVQAVSWRLISSTLKELIDLFLSPLFDRSRNVLDISARYLRGD